MPASNKATTIGLATTSAFCLMLSACVSQPQPDEPKPINKPVDALEATPAPSESPHTSQADGPLLNDVQRLQDAHSTYRRAQERRASRIRRQQAKCRSQKNSKQVAISDGSGDPDATYCQQNGG